jgi:hypothetical protein
MISLNFLKDRRAQQQNLIANLLSHNGFGKAQLFKQYNKNKEQTNITF